MCVLELFWTCYVLQCTTKEWVNLELYISHLLHCPKDLLFLSCFNYQLLDEPTNALDEDAVQLIYKIIREEKSRGATIIVATHHKEDLKEVCDVILKIAEGKIVEENENK